MNCIVFRTLVMLVFSASHVASAHMLASRSVSVRTDAKIARKSASKYTVTENVILQVKLRGKPLTSENRTMKWTVYGRDRKSHEISVIDSGESPVNFSAGESQKSEPINVATTSTRAHTITKRGRGRNSRASISRIEGSGLQYVGYGIQVFEGEKVVGEEFEPDRLEVDLQKAESPPVKATSK